MADEAPEVVIVSADGTEHVFPPGFDPIQAADIVKKQAFTPKFGDPNLHPTIGTISDDVNAEPDWKTKLGRLMESSAHPESFGDILPLLIPGGVETAVSAFKGYAKALQTANQRATKIRDIPKEMARVLYKGATAGPPIVGLDRYAPNISSAVTEGVEGAAPIPHSAVDRFAPNVSSPVTPGVEGAAQIQPTIDRYAPNVSSPASQGASQELLARPPKQATYTKLDDGTFGITGSGLKSGDSVHVVSRSGTGKMQTVGRIVSESNGVQKATLGAESKIMLTAKDVGKIRQLMANDVPPEIALKTVLSMKQGAVR